MTRIHLCQHVLTKCVAYCCCCYLCASRGISIVWKLVLSTISKVLVIYLMILIWTAAKVYLRTFVVMVMQCENYLQIVFSLSLHCVIMFNISLTGKFSIFFILKYFFFIILNGFKIFKWSKIFCRKFGKKFNLVHCNSYSIKNRKYRSEQRF